MKKKLAIFLALALTLVSSQIIFAKTDVSIGAGIPGTNPYYDKVQNVYPVELSITSDISKTSVLSADITSLISKDYSVLGAELYFKQKLFKSNLIELGVLGNINSYFALYPRTSSLKSRYSSSSLNIGMFAQINLTSKLSVYSSFYFPVLSYVNGKDHITLAKLYESGNGECGLKYMLNDKVFAGAELLYNVTDVSFGKAYVGYSF